VSGRGTLVSVPTPDASVPGELVSSPDEAHAHLVAAIATLGQSEHAVSDAIWEAYEAAAWLHDHAEHEHRYRMLMAKEGFDSIFEAYALAEFGYRAEQSTRLKRLGRLRAISPRPDRTGVIHRATERATANALRPIAAAGVLNTAEPGQIEQALEIALAMADERATSLDKTPKIQPGEIRKGMERAGIAPPAPPKLSLGEQAEINEAKLKTARQGTTSRIDRDLHWLAQHNYKASLRDAALLIIDMLDDRPAMLTELRERLS
jgi:hypothetical protein